MATLTVANFRDRCYDEAADRYFATVDVHGHRGLYRTSCIRVERVYRERGDPVWRYVRNGAAAPLAVQLMEERYLGETSCDKDQASV